MLFLADYACISAKPSVDVATFSIDYAYSQAQFDELCAIVAASAGPLRPVKTRAKKYSKYAPNLGMTLEPPSQRLHGWGRVYFVPANENLSCLQRCIEIWLCGDFDAMRAKVKLSRVELAYDFMLDIDNYSLCEAIAKRLFYRVFPLYGQSMYASYMTNNLSQTWHKPELHDYVDFASFDDAIVHYGKCRDGAVNGDFTGYLQSCARKYSKYSSNSLDVNHRASKHTTIYPKEIYDLWCVRVEMELAKSTCKNKLPLDYRNFANILDKLPSFDKFYEFREADFATFISHVAALPEAEKIRSYIWQRRISEAHDMPVVDQIRMMKAIADEIGNKSLKNKVVSNFTRKMNFQEAINRRLYPILGASRRSQPGRRPDGIALQEPLAALITIGKRKAVLRPVSQDMAQNRAKLALTGTKNENKVETMDKPKPAPSAARGDVQGP